MHIIVVVLSVLAILFLVSKSEDDEYNDINIPSIDGVEVELDPVLGNKTLDFLNTFVCKYRPATKTAVDIDGYCHPRLTAVPEHRTQRVSTLRNDESSNWWHKPFNYFASNEHEAPNDAGISAGVVVMRLPRPLQIWDLDALRDKFIQQEFLGLDSTDTTEQSKDVVRHKDTNNPLDSGAFLAVYLIRLLHGSRAEREPNSADNEGQCNDEDGECKLKQSWDGVLSEHKQRIDLLSSYLNILPNSTDRLTKPSSTKVNPYSHPLFWAPKYLQSLLPRNSHTNDLVRHYQQMIESEYEAFKERSDDFRKNVKYVDYLSMRINVLSRAFGVQAAASDNGALWGISDEMKSISLEEEMRMYETSDFGSYLDDDQSQHSSSTFNKDEFKLRSMCPLLDMYNSHPNPNVIWGYDSKTSSYIVRASQKDNIPPGHSIVVSYGKYTEGHLFAKYGYVNGDGSSPTEISLAVFHRMLGDVGLGRQFSLLPFELLDPTSRDEIFEKLLDEEYSVDSRVQKSISLAKEALDVQAKELLRYLVFDDGYNECLDLTESSGSNDEKLKLLKLKHLVRIANYREAWIVRVPPQYPDAQPLQTMESKKPQEGIEQKESVAVNANRIISICRLLSLRVDDIGGYAINYLEEGLSSASPSAHNKNFFLVEKHEETLEFRAMMCVVRLCNVALGRYLGYDNDESTLVGNNDWNTWYVMKGEVRALGILQQTAASEANRLKHKIQTTKGRVSTTDVSMKVREEGSCPLNYSQPLLSQL